MTDADYGAGVTTEEIRNQAVVASNDEAAVVQLANQPLARKDGIENGGSRLCFIPGGGVQIQPDAEAFLLHAVVQP